jgi:HPt (histidine-containing phosphotransfer) domain-containing protein
VNTLPALDPEVFDELHNGVYQSSSTVASLYRTFTDNAARLIAMLMAAESGSARQKTLHTLKGSAEMMGAARIARLAADLQQRCATLDADALTDAIQQLDQELAQMRQAVDAQLAKLDIGHARGG